MSNCILCKKDMPGIGRSAHEYGIVEKFWGAIASDISDESTLAGELCDGCGQKIIAGKITNVIEAAVAFMDQLNSFNDFYHPEVHKRALELQKAVGGLYAKKEH